VALVKVKDAKQCLWQKVSGAKCSGKNEVFFFKVLIQLKMKLGYMLGFGCFSGSYEV